MKFHTQLESTILKCVTGQHLLFTGNGLLLLQTCRPTAHELVITNTLFRLQTRNKTAWMHPRSKHWHLIDYVITRKKDASDVRVTKSMCGTDCWTDHRLLVSKLTLCIQPQRRPQGKKLIKRLNVTQLRDKSVSEDLTRVLDGKLAELHLGQATIDEDWGVLRDKIHDTAFQLLGPTTRKPRTGLMKMMKKSRKC